VVRFADASSFDSLVACYDVGVIFSLSGWVLGCERSCLNVVDQSLLKAPFGANGEDEDRRIGRTCSNEG